MPFTGRLSEIREALEAEGVSLDASRFCLFLSGGADSTALFHVMRALVGDPARLSAVTIDYGLRGEASAEDAGSAVRLCRSHGVSCLRLAAPPPPPGNLQHWARRFRRRHMARVLREKTADWVATGHQADDRLEGFLLKLFQGQTPTVLPLRRGRLLRPLLSLSRAEIRSALAAAGLPWRDDHTNGEPRYLRNRLRLDLMAHLDRTQEGWRTAWARSFEASLGRDGMMATLARNSPYLKATAGRVQLGPAWKTLPPAPARSLLAEALRTAFPGRRFTAFDFRRIAEAARAGKTEGLFPWKNALVEIEGGRIAPVEEHRVDLPLAPDRPTFAPWGTAFRVGPRPSHPPTPGAPNPRVCPLPGYDGGMLRLVHVEKGDRFTPKGQAKPVRLLRWLMNHGIPRWQRRRALKVLDGERLLTVVTARRHFPVEHGGEARWQLAWGRP